MNAQAIRTIQTVELAGERPPPTDVGLRELTPQQAVFAQWYAETRSLVTAYKAAYNVGESTMYRTMWQAAAQIAEIPAVAKRVEEIADRLAASGIVRAIEVLRDLVDMVNTDPEELVKHVKYNCRSCRGVDYKHQWIDAAEFARSLDAWAMSKMKDLTPMPSAAGGFGFVPRAAPLPECPACFGEGVERVILADTTKLSPGARKLLKGIKQDRFGVITFELHDKMQARDMILKMLGAYKADGKGLPLTGQGALDGISNADMADPRLAADAYIRMLAAPT